MIKILKTSRYRTIQRKFFWKPPLPDLLTWAAKEQIQYLHKRDPEEWSVEALTDLFPVSQEIIKNIIRSTYRLYRESDMLQHDQNVQKNWEDLLTSIENGSEVSDDVLQAFKNSQGENVIRNATGIKDLPFYLRKFDKFNPRGEFSVIVKDCYDAKENALKKAREVLDTKAEDISAVLLKVTEIMEMKSDEKTTKPTFLKPRNKKKPHMDNSDTHYTKQSTVKKTADKFESEQDSDIQRKTEKLLTQKYKDNTFNSHVKEPIDMKPGIPRKVHVKQNVQQKGNNDTCIAGDCVYDKNGVFLYRVP